MLPIGAVPPSQLSLGLINCPAITNPLRGSESTLVAVLSVPGLEALGTPKPKALLKVGRDIP